MSYADELMNQAKDIEKHAADKDYQLQVAAAGSDGGAAAIDSDAIRQKYDGKVQALFEPFTRVPDPSSYQGAVEDISSALEKLSDGRMTDPISDRVFPANADLGRIRSASDKLQDWTGAAADGFKTNFLDRFRDISTNQFIVLAVMRGALQADQAMWKKVRDDINDLAKKTLDTIDDIGSCGKTELSFVFAVASAVAAIGAIPFTGGASAAGIAAIGATASVGAAGVAGSRLEFSKDIGTVDQIIPSISEALDKFSAGIRDTQTKIVRALGDMEGSIQRDKKDFVSARPSLAGMRGGELMADSGLGTST